MQSLWVDASAGSGKTTLLVSRVIDALKSGVTPSKILVLTFTNVAAQEVSERVLAALYARQKDNPKEWGKIYATCCEKVSPFLLCIVFALGY